MSEAIRVFRTRPPHPHGGSDKQKGRSVSIAAASTAATSLGMDSSASGPEYVLMVSTTDCYICFGLSGMSAADSSDFFLPANTIVRWELSPAEETHLRVIRKSADGSLSWYLTG